MEKDSITVTQKELEKVVYEEIQKERRILFDMRLEDYFLLPVLTEKKRRGKSYISMPRSAWEEFLEQVCRTLDDLETAREIIGWMEPVYREYHMDYEDSHSFNFDNYVRTATASYDADEFERVRGMFEEAFEKNYDNAGLER